MYFIYMIYYIGFRFGLGSILVFKYIIDIIDIHRFIIYIIINIYIKYSLKEIYG